MNVIPIILFFFDILDGFLVVGDYFFLDALRSDSGLLLFDTFLSFLFNYGTVVVHEIDVLFCIFFKDLSEEGGLLIEIVFDCLNVG